MASPMVEGRVDPHKKAQYTLHVSDRIADGEVGDYTSIRYNHKPAQPTSSRDTRITPCTSANAYNLHIEDEKAGHGKDVFIFTGQKTVPKKSYILLFDPSSQSATLEPLANSYTFNVSTKNGQDMSSAYPKIYPRKQKDQIADAAAAATASQAAGDDVVDDASRDDVNIPPDADNPFDFRHFLKKGNESEYGTSSPDDRTGTGTGTGTGSAINTPQVAAVRKPPATSNLSAKAKVPTQAAPKPRKRKSPEPPTKKAQSKKPPAVRLERRATADVKAESKPAKPTKKAAAAAAAASKIKSAEIIHSSDDESDLDGDGEPDTQPSPPHHRRLPAPPVQRQQPRHDPYEPASEEDEDEDEEMEDVGGSGSGGLDLEFEIPDEQPSRPRQALRPNLGYLASPANGPISLASAASSVEGTPRKNRNANAMEYDDGVIDFGDGDRDGAASDDEDADGDVDDQDVVPMYIGPPAQTRRVSEGGMDVDDVDEEEEDPLYKEMMEGLAGGDSSEESEEE